ncbi:hypothetical protein [Argonema galeatum]|uniref:hypothetical protein n=1 Tax=Argonema galeatum TaxID=2942762 RepID=UPI002012EDC5|nr:hypothetical protein [Argonema galeatum]MCL1466043.1 hypothetical protein [Argonema galeatum A003/A1]
MITLNISDFTGVSAAELHATTGDIGVFIRAINDKLASFYFNLGTADRPARWSVIKGTGSAVAINGAVNPQRIPYTVNVDVAAPAAQYEIVPE